MPIRAKAAPACQLPDRTCDPSRTA
jgi:hypothetical protein